MERRVGRPFRFWIAGLLTELTVLMTFVAVLIVLAVVVAWVVG